ncbi:M16 family metallopeptidase [Gelidibacter mesophilus]|uniref:M16 family metallopeptidase n=1 Tax=Gelidibacter mesophilus TaxID=169050 RepID=UPI0004158C79|nr:M16 family metallopeptidase [Gelidibacter mesophilus]
MKIFRILLVFVFLLSSYGLSAQTDVVNIKNLNSKIPIDPTVKIGKLGNGLTYYIKHNPKPSDKAELRLVLNVGSILEDEDQQGLAHFIEHMAFNGTKSFEKNKLIDYLQSLGVEFGADLNAHTSFDETVYKLSIPTDDPEIFNTSLSVLRDWADGITFSHQEIDNERGIVAEELRARSGASTRMYYQSIPMLTNNSRYAKRLPIGTLDVIMNSEYDALKRFYKDWYRPDLMALVVVGDFDVAETEEKVKKMFGGLKVVKNPRERVYYDINDNEAPSVSIITDKEAQGVSISIYHKKRGTEVETLKDYKEQLLQMLYSGMLKQRLAEVEKSSEAPFLSANAGMGKFLGPLDSYYLRAILKEDKVNEGIEALLTESERARRFGFKTSELERYKAELLNSADLYRKETGKIPTRNYVERYIDNYTDNKPIPSDAFRYNFYNEILPTITVEDVNNLTKKWISDKNIAVVINAIEKDDLKLPTVSEILELLNRNSKKKVEPYVDTLENLKLMTEIPKEGEIISSTYNDKVDMTMWKFANGVTVIAKPTSFQNDMISMNGFRPGGSSVAPDSIYVSARSAGNIIGASGINNVSNIDLDKLNMGKSVKVTPYINFYDELLSGSSSAADLERMLQMTYLYFTAPNKDRNVFDAYKANSLSLYKDQDKSPDAVLRKKISEVMTQNHLRGIPLTEKQVEKEMDLDIAFDFYKERFASANGFTFVFVGNFDIEKLKTFTTQYLGSLPSNINKTSTWSDIGLRRPEGIIKNTVVKGIDDKSQVVMNFSGSLDFTLEKKEQLTLLGKLLKIKLTEELREKMSGVYGVRVSGFAANRPNDWYRMNIEFTCAPENIDRLKNKVFEEIEKIKRDGASQKDLNKLKEAELSRTKEWLTNNSYWIAKLKEAYEFDLKYRDILNYETQINELSTKDFKDAANTYFDENNYAEFILLPESIVKH